MPTTPATTIKAGSLPDQTHGDLEDRRKGAYDPAGGSLVPDANRQTPHEREQPGADVRGEPIPTREAELPEGLKRDPKGPYGKNSGRGEIAEHAPGKTNRQERT